MCCGTVWARQDCVKVGNLHVRSGPNLKEIVQEGMKSGGFGAFVGGLGQTGLRESGKLACVVWAKPCHTLI